ncbi:hypothetical protein G6F31_018365 [Rhizopus arrhizus]|nr:hypothetical protein G6F31_018365 [Rhizopus arrhizus]
MPTSRPATIRRGVPASTVTGGSAATSWYNQGAAHKPSRNATRHRPSRCGGSKPPRMPLIPALRPAPAINSTAAAPINRPPAVADAGVRADQSGFTRVTPLRGRTGHLVVDVLAVAARRNEPFVAQHAQLLGQGRLADAGQRFQFTYVAFVLHQLAQQQQAVFVGQRLEQRAGLGGGFAQDGKFAISQGGIHKAEWQVG